MKLKTLTLSLLAMMPLAALAQSALPKGTIQCFETQGSATLVNNLTGEEMALQRGMAFTEDFSVRTSEASSTLLIMSNGSSISLKEGSLLSFVEYRQAKTGSSESYVRIQADPSESHSQLFLASGRLVGEIKKLRPESTFVISTPTGIAEVLGTIVDISVGPDGTTLNVWNGTVGFQQNGQNFTVPGGQSAGPNGTQPNNNPAPSTGNPNPLPPSDNPLTNDEEDDTPGAPAAGGGGGGAPVPGPTGGAGGGTQTDTETTVQ